MDTMDIMDIMDSSSSGSGGCRKHARRWLRAAAALCLLACLLGAVQGASRRVKRALYQLPDGAELLLGRPPRTGFSCDGLGYGYYADPDNECKLFHVCQAFKMADGSIFENHASFVCANQTVFNQVTLTCSHPEDAVPCESARDFYYVNDYFGDAAAPSVRDADLRAAHELVSRAYGSRLSPAAEP